MGGVKRFSRGALAGFLAALMLSFGLSFGAVPGWAQDPVPNSPPEESAQPPLDAEEVGQPDGELPLPYPERPDGTLKLPHPGTDVPEAVILEESPEASEAVADEENVSWEALLADLEPADAERSRVLMEADRLYLAGNTEAAQKLYKQVKTAKWGVDRNEPPRVVPITDPDQLPPAAAVYWREAQAGTESGIATRVMVPLELLVKNYPEFLPGQALYVQFLIEHDRADEAIAVIDQAVSEFPYHPILLKAQTQALMAQEKWLEAAIAARQFTLFNPDDPEAEAMLQLSEDNVSRFRSEMRERLTGNLLSNIVTGAAGYILTGGLLGPFTAINSSVTLLQGESAIGERVANQAIAQLPMMEDEAVDRYVDEMGAKLAALTGRDEFDYEFYVVMDEELNAFALPGGKIFINAGAIMKTRSEAELAGLLGHEISHAVLSHSFQMVTQGNLTNSLAAFIPVPEIAGLAANLAFSGYSREMERQADVLGTQILSAGDYAADGLYNLMTTLRDETDGAPTLSWFSTHPATNERVNYLKHLVDQGGFTRFAYEGVEPHLKIQKQVKQRMAEYEAEQAERK